uniref:Uncharacterized protein n=1 Tax=Zooxanthella nutricula TaxID=1333877 RepID=A0A7S2JA06_9DINO
MAAPPRLRPSAAFAVALASLMSGARAAQEGTLNRGVLSLAVPDLDSLYDAKWHLKEALRLLKFVEGFPGKWLGEVVHTTVTERIQPIFGSQRAPTIQQTITNWACKIYWASMARLKEIDVHVQGAAYKLAGGRLPESLEQGLEWSLEQVYEDQVIRGSRKCPERLPTDRTVSLRKFDAKFKKIALLEDQLEDQNRNIDLEQVLPYHVVPTDKRAEVVEDQTFAQASDRWRQAINFIDEAIRKGRTDKIDSALGVLLDR